MVWVERDHTDALVPAWLPWDTLVEIIVHVLCCLLLLSRVSSVFLFLLFPLPPPGDEGDPKSRAVPMEEEEDDDDDDPENRYDSIHKDLKKIITHPRRGRKPAQRKSKQVVKTRTACLVKTRSQASRKFEQGARKQRPKSRNAKKVFRSVS